MNRTEARQHAAELVIALCLCGGGWYFLVKPAQAGLANARAEIATLEAQKSAWVASDLPADQAREMLEEATQRAKVIDQRSAAARDESVMFASVMDLAARHDIRMDQLAPGGRRSGPTAPKGPVDPAAPPPPTINDTAVSYTLTVTSSYASLAAFLRDLNRDLGYSVIKSVRLAPSESAEQKIVTATVITEHLAFDTAPVWKSCAAATQLDAAPALSTSPAAQPSAAAQPQGE